MDAKWKKVAQLCIKACGFTLRIAKFEIRKRKSQQQQSNYKISYHIHYPVKVCKDIFFLEILHYIIFLFVDIILNYDSEFWHAQSEG